MGIGAPVRFTPSERAQIRALINQYHWTLSDIKKSFHCSRNAVYYARDNRFNDDLDRDSDLLSPGFHSTARTRSTTQMKTFLKTTPKTPRGLKHSTRSDSQDPGPGLIAASHAVVETDLDEEPDNDAVAMLPAHVASDPFIVHTRVPKGNECGVQLAPAIKQDLTTRTSKFNSLQELQRISPIESNIPTSELSDLLASPDPSSNVQPPQHLRRTYDLEKKADEKHAVSEHDLMVPRSISPHTRVLSSPPIQRPSRQALKQSLKSKLVSHSPSPPSFPGLTAADCDTKLDPITTFLDGLARPLGKYAPAFVQEGVCLPADLSDLKRLSAQSQLRLLWLVRRRSGMTGLEQVIILDALSR